jgi:hypothetical protein
MQQFVARLDHIFHGIRRLLRGTQDHQQIADIIGEKGVHRRFCIF